MRPLSSVRCSSGSPGVRPHDAQHAVEAAGGVDDRLAVASHVEGETRRERGETDRDEGHPLPQDRLRLGSLRAPLGQTRARERERSQKQREMELEVAREDERCHEGREQAAERTACGDPHVVAREVLRLRPPPRELAVPRQAVDEQHRRPERDAMQGPELERPVEAHEREASRRRERERSQLAAVIGPGERDDERQQVEPEREHP